MHSSAHDLSLSDRADQLLRAEGWLDAATPVLCFDPAGEPLAFNPAARPLMTGGGEMFDKVATIAMAAREGVPLADTVTIIAADGGQVVVDVLAMPRPAEGLVLVSLRDRSLEASLREALIDSRSRFRDLVNISGTFAWEVDAQGVLTFVSQRGALGFAAEELWGQPVTNLVAHDEEESRAALTPPMLVENIEVALRHKDGTEVPHVVSAVPLFGADGQWNGARGVCRDIGGERQRDRELARLLHRERVVARVLRTFRGEVDPTKALAKAVDVIAKGIAADCCHVVAATPSLTAEKPRFEILAGYGASGPAEALQEVLDHHDTEAPVVFEVDGWQVLVAPTWSRDSANGLLIAWRLQGAAPWGEDDRGLVQIFSLQTGTAIEQVHHHRRLMTIASTDPLTGLLNRRGFEQEARRRYGRLQRSGRQAVMMYVDLDNFKLVNDTHGHATGDEALLFVRDLLRNNSRPTDLVARVGGDEFVLWLDGAGTMVAERCAKVLITAATALRRFSGHESRPLGMSIGAVVHDPRNPESFDDLIARADRVMYEVKNNGKGGYAVAPPQSASGELL